MFKNRYNAFVDIDWTNALSIARLPIALVGFGLVIYTVIWVFSHHFVMPINDDIYDRMRFISARPSWGDVFEYMIAAHNEHRITTTRLIALFDDYVTRGKQYSQIIICVLLQLAMAFTSSIVIARSELHRRDIIGFTLSLSVVTVLFVNPMFLYTFVVQFQIQHTLMATLVIGMAAWMTTRLATIPSWREFLTFISVAVISGVVASFTLGNAPVILMTCAGMAVLARWPTKFTVIIMLAAAAHLMITLLTKQSAIQAGGSNIYEIIEFVLIYLGSPFLRFGAWPSTFVTWTEPVMLAYVFGLVTVGVFGTGVALKLIRPSVGGATMTFGIFVLTCIVITAFAAAHSRSSFGVLEGANKKYASFAALSWVGALAISVGVVQEIFDRWKGLSLTALYVLIAAVLFPLSYYSGQSEMRIWQKAADRNAESSIAVLFNINSEPYLHDLYPNPPAAVNYFTDIQRRNLTVFSRYAARWGDDVGVKLSGYTQGACRGEVERVDPIASSDIVNVFDVSETPFTIGGWAWMTEIRAPASYVLAVDAGNRIVGFALTTRISTRAEEWLSQKFISNVGWFGFARIASGLPERFYAVYEPTKKYCVIVR